VPEWIKQPYRRITEDKELEMFERIAMLNRYTLNGRGP
jgi:hypothetical protein